MSPRSGTLGAKPLGAVENGEEGFEPEGGEEELAILQSIAESNDWAAMPDRLEIDEWEIMNDFASSLSGGVGDELARAIRGRGAFRMFKDAVYCHGMEERWFQFKRLAVERIAIDVLEAEGIPYHR